MAEGTGRIVANVSATLLALVLPWFALVLNVAVRLNWLRRHYGATPSTGAKQGQPTN